MRPKLIYLLKYSVVNLLIVALLGVLMRYKIGFEFPYFDQKHIQHAHSHFAFTGWITHTLYVLMIIFIRQFLDEAVLKKYQIIIIGNLICAYGMLISFAIEGYGAVSITFSTASVFISYIFSFCFIRDLKFVETSNPSRKWFKAALLFNVLSSAGTFALAYMMATKNLHQNSYLASVYYYLHFQYNGWFFFACMGLLIRRINIQLPVFKYEQSIFWMFALACIPAYFLSALWLEIPTWLYVLVVISAAVQVIAWGGFLISIKENLNQLRNNIPVIGQYLFLLVAIALSIKLLLQLGSTIPAMSKLAFGFRPIVIAYLHLVLLAVISVFLLTYLYSYDFIIANRLAVIAIIIFVAGVFLNEMVLAIQGIASFSYTAVPFANEALFFIAVSISLGLLLLTVSQFAKRNS